MKIKYLPDFDYEENLAMTAIDILTAMANGEACTIDCGLKQQPDVKMFVEAALAVVERMVGFPIEFNHVMEGKDGKITSASFMDQISGSNQN